MIGQKDNPFNESPDLDLPIAIRKQTRSCTLNPISKSTSYNALSTKFRTFITNIYEKRNFAEYLGGLGITQMESNINGENACVWRKIKLGKW